MVVCNIWVGWNIRTKSWLHFDGLLRHSPNSGIKHQGKIINFSNHCTHWNTDKWTFKAETITTNLTTCNFLKSHDLEKKGPRRPELIWHFASQIRKAG